MKIKSKATSGMFDWLVDEMATVKTGKFFLIDGPAFGELRQAVESSDFPLPPSYKAFVLQYGNAELYRCGSSYYVTVLAGPREAENRKGEAFIHFGGTWTSRAYFKESMLVNGKESPVFEDYGQGGIRRTGDGFETWLRAKCRVARKRYSRDEWTAIENGPPPFTAQESAIVEARRSFQWRVIGKTRKGEIKYEVWNRSDRRLPFLSIGIRGKTSTFEGGVWLPVGHIAPGKKAVVVKDTYLEILDPNDVEAYPLPDPEPEDRSQYWEFRATS